MKDVKGARKNEERNKRPNRMGCTPYGMSIVNIEWWVFTPDRICTQNHPRFILDSISILIRWRFAYSISKCVRTNDQHNAKLVEKTPFFIKIASQNSIRYPSCTSRVRCFQLPPHLWSKKSYRGRVGLRWRWSNGWLMRKDPLIVRQCAHGTNPDWA